MIKAYCGILILSFVLAGCGQMGPLYLPSPTPDKNANQTHLDDMIKSA